MRSSFWNLDRVMKLLFAAAGCAALFWLLSYLAVVLLPFGIAFLFAYMLDPLVCLVQRKVRSRAAASLSARRCACNCATTSASTTLRTTYSAVSHWPSVE